MRMIEGMMVAVLLAACGGSQDTNQTPVIESPPDETPPEDTTPPEEVKKEEPPPPPKKLTLEERIAYHEGCFQDFLKEAPDLFDRCYSDESTHDLVDSGMPPASGKADEIDPVARDVGEDVGQPASVLRVEVRAAMRILVALVLRRQDVEIPWVFHRQGSKQERVQHAKNGGVRADA